jgi:hypothetical protein
VVGFTHKSIDNLLQKITELRGKYLKKISENPGTDYSGLTFSLPVGRLSSEAGGDGWVEGVEFLKSDTLYPTRFVKSNLRCVVAGTTWSVRKAFNSKFQAPPEVRRKKGEERGERREEGGVGT